MRRQLLGVLFCFALVLLSLAITFGHGDPVSAGAPPDVRSNPLVVGGKQDGEPAAEFTTLAKLVSNAMPDPMEEHQWGLDEVGVVDWAATPPYGVTYGIPTPSDGVSPAEYYYRVDDVDARDIYSGVSYSHAPYGGDNMVQSVGALTDDRAFEVYPLHSFSRPNLAALDADVMTSYISEDLPPYRDVQYAVPDTQSFDETLIP